ncbi:MAG TPA: endopeptidase La [Candidatus Babeliales bacterium]|nr:endopeptidase La [Candidatus Babeliales bacterium]
MLNLATARIMIGLLLLTSTITFTRPDSGDLTLNEQLLLLVQQGTPAEVEAALQAGAFVDFQDDQGFTAIMQASRLGNTEMVKILLNYKADVNLPNHLNDTPLKWAAYNGHLSTVKLLMRNGAELEARDVEGNTALMDAAGKGHVHVVEYLIKQKADIDAVNIRNESALAKAKKNKHPRVVALLRKNKAREDEDDDAPSDPTAAWLAKLKKLPIPQENKKELRRLIKLQADGALFNAERATTQEYLELVFSLPWDKTTNDNLDIKNARAILEEEHYGLDDVKEKILDYIATLNFRKDGKAPIICLVGPPGTGKTSICKSIARALGRRFTRLAVGGLHDESGLRGHVRTYIGARPGRIVQAIKHAQSMNPVMVIDEIDKMGGNGYHGDPSAAMLEVLDPEQNDKFRDNYLEVPLNLSQVLFIATANYIEDIPAPLRDRMEIIELSCYSAEEKLEIAEKHLLNQVIAEAGLSKKDVKISREVLAKIIKLYSREAGVREVKRKLARLMAKIARNLVENKKGIVIDSKNIEKHLGLGYEEVQEEIQDRVGVANGLWASSRGGGLERFEALLVPRTEHEELLKITGKMGDMTQESAHAALSYIRVHAKELGINPTIFNNNAIHFHTALWHADGPSAGITTIVAFVSALTNRPVRGNYAMTGEINLRGQVLPIGGVKEKLLAAKNKGMNHVIFPKQNKRDVEDINPTLRSGIEIIYVEHIDQVLSLVLM